MSQWPSRALETENSVDAGFPGQNSVPEIFASVSDAGDWAEASDNTAAPAHSVTHDGHRPPLQLPFLRHRPSYIAKSCWQYRGWKIADDSPASWAFRRSISSVRQIRIEFFLCMVAVWIRGQSASLKAATCAALQRQPTSDVINFR